MERSCQVRLLAKAAGKVIHIDPGNAELTHKQLGNCLRRRLNAPRPRLDPVAFTAVSRGAAGRAQQRLGQGEHGFLE